jgi:hypothetical protein
MVARNRLKRSGKGSASKSRLKKIEWGFDLTDAKSDRAFLDLMDKFKFKKMSWHNPTDIYPSVITGGTPITYGSGFDDRFKEFVVTFVNPSGIRMTVEHLGGKDDEDGALGYIGIKAPASARGELHKFLAAFRGDKPIKEWDWNGNAGIVKYVKQEEPNVSGFISVG